ncbi:hypothetical protein Aduo_006224 [Ancylostoma duodenale]
MESYMVNEQAEVYEGPSNREALATKFGKHSLMCYKVPGTDESYTFTFKRMANDHQLYQCQQCKIKGKVTGKRMIGNEFVPIPAPWTTTLSVIPSKRHTIWWIGRFMRYKNLITGIVLKVCINCSTVAWKQTRRMPRRLPSRCGMSRWPPLRRELQPEMYQAIACHHYSRGCVSRRSSIKRVLKTQNSDEAGATMTYIPATLSILPDGNTVQMAARNGLHTLVADGVHSFQPPPLKRKGQLYTVHGVCHNDVEVPLLYAISSKLCTHARMQLCTRTHI